MCPRASRKIPDGKLVRVDLDVSDRIDQATITGDFFVEPPSAREAFEAAIEGHPRTVDRDRLRSALAAVEATPIGFSIDDLADLTREALDD